MHDSPHCKHDRVFAPFVGGSTCAKESESVLGQVWRLQGSRWLAKKSVVKVATKAASAFFRCAAAFYMLRRRCVA